MKCREDYRMKKLLQILFFICITSLTLYGAVTLKEADSYKDALKKGIKEHKHVILFAHSPFCPWCRKMEHDTLSNKKVIKLLNDKYIFISIDLSLSMDIEDVPTKFLPRGTPTTYVIDPTNEDTLYTMRGYKSPKSFLFRLGK
jgi:thioredoxin-related protein